MRATGISGWAIRLGRSVGGRPKNGGCGSLFRSTLSALRGEGDEGCDGGVDVDDGAAREVEGTLLKEPAVALPDPVADRGVDEQ